MCLEKTLAENHLGLMHRGTIKVLGGKLPKKPNMNLRPLHCHLGFPTPGQLEDLGRGRGGLQGGGTSGAWVGEGDRGGTVLGWGRGWLQGGGSGGAWVGEG